MDSSVDPPYKTRVDLTLLHACLHVIPPCLTIKILFLSAGVKERARSMWDRGKKCESIITASFTSSPRMHCRCTSDPLVHHGRHFGRTVHAMTKIQALITNGLLRMVDLAESPDEDFTAEYVICV
jgi:hypothetical protein